VLYDKQKLGGFNMTENVDKLEQVKIQLQGEIDTLEERYAELNKGIESLENSKNYIKDSMKAVQDEFKETNENIKDILDRLDKLNTDIEQNMEEKPEENVKQGMFFQNVFKTPIRKLAVGTMSAVYALADKTAEGTSGIKDGLDDIVTEAKSKNEKRRMSPYEQG
jgi:DNA repair exonuclease SbcCD ATPase subunit